MGSASDLNIDDHFKPADRPLQSNVTQAEIVVILQQMGAVKLFQFAVELFQRNDRQLPENLCDLLQKLRFENFLLTVFEFFAVNHQNVKKDHNG